MTIVTVKKESFVAFCWLNDFSQTKNTWSAQPSLRPYLLYSFFIQESYVLTPVSCLVIETKPSFSKYSKQDFEARLEWEMGKLSAI